MPGSSLLDSFKETEIGPIPVDWDVVQFDKLCRLGRENVDPQELPEMPYVGLEHIDSGEPQLRRWGNSSQVKSSKKHFFPGDVLYGKLRPYLDKAVLAEFEGICSTDILVLKADRDLTAPEFLVHTLHTQPFLSYAISTTSGTNLPRTRWTSLKNLKIALPPLPEQRRIAHVLSTIQRAIAAQDDLIAAAREGKRSLMQRLFTYGPGPEPASTKETEFGEIPEYWEVVRLGDFVEMKYGYRTSIPKEPPPNGVKIISTAEILSEGRLDLFKIRTVEIPVHLVERYTVQQNDILFNWRNAPKHVGKTAIVEFTPRESMIFASFIIRIRTLERLNFQFLHFLITYLRDKGKFVRLSRRAVNQANFNANELGDLQIPLPALDEQDEITQVLSSAERKIKAEEQRKAALQALFKAMLHQLMTGQLRVKKGL